MQGMIQDAMKREDGDEHSPEAVRSNMQIPPDLQRAYDKTVLAGMKLMFSKETHQLMLKEFEREGPLSKRLGEGVAGMMLMLFQESNRSLPPQVLIPAGTDLLVQAADFIKKSGLEKVTNKDIADGLEIMIGVLFEKFGISTDKVLQMVGNYDRTAVKDAQPTQGA